VLRDIQVRPSEAKLARPWLEPCRENGGGAFSRLLSLSEKLRITEQI